MAAGMFADMDGILAKAAGLSAGGGTHTALGQRANVVALTSEALKAVIAPRQEGGLSLTLRAALACRVARLNHNDDLAAYFRDAVTDADAELICDPSNDGGSDPRIGAILQFTDRVTRHAKDVAQQDIDALKEAGVADDDIVRLAELNAFLAYFVRVVEGLSLMESTHE